MTHEWDWCYDWCIHCGAGLADVKNGVRDGECNRGVIGISHIIARRRIEEIVSDFVGTEA